MEAKLDRSTGCVGSCIRWAASEKKFAVHIHARQRNVAAKHGFEGGRSQPELGNEMEPWCISAAATSCTRRKRATELHGSGTKFGAAALNCAKPGSVRRKAAARWKALAGCGLRRSLARRTCGKDSCGPKLCGSNSFQRRGIHMRATGDGEYALSPEAQSKGDRRWRRG